MIGLLRRRGGLLAPVLFGSLLTGGCQLFGTNSEPLTPPGYFNDKMPKANVQPPAPADAAGLKQNTEQDFLPKTQAAQTDPAPHESRGVGGGFRAKGQGSDQG